ncbi:MAG: hypothetical protein HDS73_04045 [Bacteroidales bacterium]|nr:hypothetical protein [Bacteroidales bacterium]
MGNSFTFNNIQIIQSLDDEDRKTGTELYNDLLRWQPYKHDALSVSPVSEVNTLAEFRATLADIATEREAIGVGMILHLEMHGADDKSGVVLNSRERMTWQELGDALREINIATHNNLMVTMATCYGGYLIQNISIDRQAPMYFMLGSMREEYEDDLLEAYTVCYQTLFDTFQIGEAYSTMRRQCGASTDYFWPINEEDIFYIVYGGYLMVNCTPSAVEQRAKESISRIGMNRAEWRKAIKDFINLEKQTRNKYFKKYKDLFFMLDEPANKNRFDIPDDILEFNSAFKKFRNEHPWFYRK